MPTFEAKSKDELTRTAEGVKSELYEAESQKPGSSIPVADQDGLRELGATEFYPRHWEYRHTKHTCDDLKRPGYFEGEARARLRPGDEIHFCVQGGSKLPSEWKRGICVVEENPNTRELPVILAGYFEYPQPTPWTGGKNGKAKAA